MSEDRKFIKYIDPRRSDDVMLLPGISLTLAMTDRTIELEPMYDARFGTLEMVGVWSIPLTKHKAN